jgi:hypothetical protein
LHHLNRLHSLKPGQQGSAVTFDLATTDRLLSTTRAVRTRLDF